MRGGSGGGCEFNREPPSTYRKRGGRFDNNQPFLSTMATFKFPICEPARTNSDSDSRNSAPFLRWNTLPQEYSPWKTPSPYPTPWKQQFAIA